MVIQGGDYVPVLQTEVIVRLALKTHQNDINTIWLSLKNTYFLKVTRVLLEIWACHTLFRFELFSLLDRSPFLSNVIEIWKNGTNIIWRSIKDASFPKITRVLLKNLACHALLHFGPWNIEMSVMGSFF